MQGYNVHFRGLILISLSIVWFTFISQEKHKRRNSGAIREQIQIPRWQRAFRTVPDEQSQWVHCMKICFESDASNVDLVVDSSDATDFRMSLQSQNMLRSKSLITRICCNKPQHLARVVANTTTSHSKTKPMVRDWHLLELEQHFEHVAMWDWTVDLPALKKLFAIQSFNHHKPWILPTCTTDLQDGFNPQSEM